MYKKLVLLLKAIAKGKKRWYILVISILFILDKMFNEGRFSEYFLNILNSL